MTLKIAIAALFAAGLAGGADAATLTYFSQSVSPTTPDWNVMVSFPQFNPAFGTMYTVVANLDSTISGYQYVENRQGIAAPALPSNQAIVELNLPGLIGKFVSAPQWVGNPTTLSAFDGTLDYSGSSATFASGTGTDSRITQTVLVSAYVGTGLVHGALSAYTLFAEGVQTDPLASYFSHSDVGAIGSITYVYQPAAVGGVPEPASWAMLIAGFGLTGAAMRRRRGTTVVSA